MNKITIEFKGNRTREYDCSGDVELTPIGLAFKEDEYKSHFYLFEHVIGWTFIKGRVITQPELELV